MQGSDFAPREVILQGVEGAARFLGSRLPDVQAAAEEPAPLAFAFVSNDGLGIAHWGPLSGLQAGA